MNKYHQNLKFAVTINGVEVPTPEEEPPLPEDATRHPSDSEFVILSNVKAGIRQLTSGVHTGYFAEGIELVEKYLQDEDGKFSALYAGENPVFTVREVNTKGEVVAESAEFTWEQVQALHKEYSEFQSEFKEKAQVLELEPTGVDQDIKASAPKAQPEKIELAVGWASQTERSES